MIESYIENIQDRIRTLIWQTNLSNEDKLILSYINSHRGWYKFNEEEIKIKSNEETVKVQRHRDFIKTLFRQVRKRNKKPCVRKISMHLDAKVFEIKPKDEGKAKTFDYWLSLTHT